MLRISEQRASKEVELDVIFECARRNHISIAGPDRRIPFPLFDKVWRSAEDQRT